MESVRSEKILVWLLRILGGMAVLAVVPMVMPTDWMGAVNNGLGLEPLHRAPLTEYLTRSLSALYAANGLLVLYLSRDVRCYAELLVFIGWLTVALGLTLTAIDFWAGMPAFWSWTEGPPTVVVGWLIIWLAKRV